MEVELYVTIATYILLRYENAVICDCNSVLEGFFCFSTNGIVDELFMISFVLTRTFGNIKFKGYGHML